MKHACTIFSTTCGAAALALALSAGAESGAPQQHTSEAPTQQPGELADTPSEQKLMGYGTDGIPEEVDSYSLGNRSNLGAPQAGEQPDFSSLDSDGDGFLSQSEAGSIDSEQWRGMDANGDGRIDSSEFSAFEPATEPATPEP